VKKAVNILFFVEKQKVSLLAYHHQGLGVPLALHAPQFANHCTARWNDREKVGTWRK